MNVGICRALTGMEEVREGWSERAQGMAHSGC